MFDAQDLIDNLTVPSLIAAHIAGLDANTIKDMTDVESTRISSEQADALANLGKCLAMTQAAMARQQLDCMLVQGFTREEAVQIIARQPLKAGG